MNTFFNRIFLSLIVLGAIPLSGCQSTWNPEATFGSSVKNAISNQVANKNAPEPVDRNSMGMEGAAAKSSIDNYQKSFETTNSGAIYGSSGTGSFVSSSGGSALPTISGK